MQRIKTAKARIKSMPEGMNLRVFKSLDMKLKDKSALREARKIHASLGLKVMSHKPTKTRMPLPAPI